MIKTSSGIKNGKYQKLHAIFSALAMGLILITRLPIFAMEYCAGYGPHTVKASFKWPQTNYQKLELTSIPKNDPDGAGPEVGALTPTNGQQSCIGSDGKWIIGCETTCFDEIGWLTSSCQCKYTTNGNPAFCSDQASREDPDPTKQITYYRVDKLSQNETFFNAYCINFVNDTTPLVFHPEAPNGCKAKCVESDPTLFTVDDPTTEINEGGLIACLNGDGTLNTTCAQGHAERNCGSTYSNVSGIEPSALNADVFWYFRESGFYHREKPLPAFYAFKFSADPNVPEIIASVQVPYVGAKIHDNVSGKDIATGGDCYFGPDYTNWEDMSILNAADGTHWIYVLDGGSKKTLNRDNIEIHRFKEPKLNPTRFQAYDYTSDPAAGFETLYIKCPTLKDLYPTEMTLDDTSLSWDWDPIFHNAPSQMCPLSMELNTNSNCVVDKITPTNEECTLEKTQCPVGEQGVNCFMESLVINGQATSVPSYHLDRSNRNRCLDFESMAVHPNGEVYLFAKRAYETNPVVSPDKIDESKIEGSQSKLKFDESYKDHEMNLVFKIAWQSGTSKTSPATFLANNTGNLQLVRNFDTDQTTVKGPSDSEQPFGELTSMDIAEAISSNRDKEGQRLIIRNKMAAFEFRLPEDELIQSGDFDSVSPRPQGITLTGFDRIFYPKLPLWSSTYQAPLYQASDNPNCQGLKDINTQIMESKAQCQYQGEGITYAANRRDLITNSEGKDNPFPTPHLYHEVWEKPCTEWRIGNPFNQHTSGPLGFALPAPTAGYNVIGNTEDITWATNRPSNSRVCFKKKDSNEQERCSTQDSGHNADGTGNSNSGKLSHTVHLPIGELDRDTDYVYRVESTLNETGITYGQEIVTSNELTFRTPTGPVTITEGSVKVTVNLTDYSAVFDWTTSKLATSVVHYSKVGSGVWKDNLNTPSSFDYTISHHLSTNDCNLPEALVPNTDYEYYVESTDNDGNTAFNTRRGEQTIFSTNGFMRGDADGDGKITITDAVYILNYLFTGGQVPACMDAADVDDSGLVDVSDPVSLLQYQFLGGAAPAAPFPTQGADPTQDSLSCQKAGGGNVPGGGEVQSNVTAEGYSQLGSQQSYAEDELIFDNTVHATEILGTSANIAWQTGLMSSSQVDYDLESAYNTSHTFGMSTTQDTTLRVAHSVALTGLQPSTSYVFRAKFSNPSSGSQNSGIFKLRTQTLFSRGDVNSDGNVADISDVQALSGFISQSIPIPSCLKAADVNDDGTIDITDQINLQNFYTSGAPTPAAPYPALGPDPTEDQLSCDDAAFPTVSMSAPANGADVGGSAVVVSASASDDIGVVGVQFKLDGANLGTEDTASPFAITWDASGVTAGNHTLTAVARDARGHSKTSASISVTVDNTAPTVSITAPAAGATVLGTAVTVSASASDNRSIAGVQFKLDGANLGAEDTATPFSISWNTTLAADGAHILTAVARDAAGNTTTASNISINVDNTAPTISITAPANGARVGGGGVSGLLNVTVSGNAADSVSGVAGVQFKLDAANLGAEDTVSPYSLTWNTGSTAEGTHTLTAVARDAVGNSRTSAAITITVDRTNPTISAMTKTNITSNTATVTWTTNEPASSQVVYRTTPTATWTESTTDFALLTSHSVLIKNLLPNTSYYFSARSQDEAKNTPALPASLRFQTKMTVTVTAPTNAAYVRGTITVSGDASGNGGNGAVVGVQFKLDGANLGAEDTTSPYSVFWNTTGASAGAHTLSAVVRNKICSNCGGGNTGTAPTVNVTVDNTTPTVSAVSATGITSDQATINWTTNEVSDSKVEYGLTTSYGSYGTNASLVTSHSMILGYLTSSTLYHYRVTSKDAAGNSATSSDYTFTTTGSGGSGSPGWVIEQQAKGQPDGRASEKFLSPALADGINDVATFGSEAQEVTILDVDGNKVFNTAQKSADNIVWNCRDESGNLVASGVYIAKIQRKDGSVLHQSFAVVK